VYSDAARRDDAKYVTAALRAAAQATGMPAVVSQRDVATLGPAADWIVWLAAQPVPELLLEQTRRGATLLTDARGDSVVERPVRVLLAGAGDLGGAPPALRRHTLARANEAPLWTDDAGNPVLTVRRAGAGRELSFHARFHPSWGDVVLHPAFPAAIARLWAEGRRPPADGATIAVSQLLPARVAMSATTAPARRELYHVFWLLAVILFLVERAWSRRARAVTA
jgi:hypothetical protein